MFKGRRLRKFKKEAAAAVKYGRRLNKKYGARVGEASVARVEEAVAALAAAADTDAIESIKAHYDVLQEVIGREYDGIRKSPQREYFESIGIAVLVALLLRTFIIEAFTMRDAILSVLAAGGRPLDLGRLGARQPGCDGGQCGHIDFGLWYVAADTGFTPECTALARRIEMHPISLHSS